MSANLLQVVEAMWHTITCHLGGLPPQHFTVEVSAKQEDFAQLMHSMMMTGYMFRNAQYKLELHSSMFPRGQHRQHYHYSAISQIHVNYTLLIFGLLYCVHN